MNGPLRLDIQGLRCVAVLLVVLFHLWPTAISGGYVGVDVFFVVSGYVITQQLCREIDETGRFSLLAFWARRFKRLLPSAFAVLAFCLVCTLTWVPEHLRLQYCRELMAAAVYVQNWALAADAVDYFGATNSASPAQHFWSLSVEEQFYVLLPLATLLALALAQRRLVRSAGFRSVLLGLIFILATLSLGAALGEASYFSTFARAWEFGLGAALALSGLRCEHPTTGSAVASLGLCSIVFGAFLSDEGGARTHSLALETVLAVLGASSVIWAEDSAALSPLSRLHHSRTSQFVAKVSYTLYLWHWPLLVFTSLALGRSVDNLEKIAIAAASLLTAWGTTTWIEQPIRHSRSITSRTLWLGSALATIAVLFAGSLGLAGAAHLQAEASRTTRRVLASDPPCFGAAASPNRPACENPALGDVLIPDAHAVRYDDENRKECWATTGETDLRMCQLGPRRGYRKRLAALGDSHNNALLPAYEFIALTMGWRIDVAGKIGCYWTTAIQQQLTRAKVEECELWKAHLNARLASDEPYDAIIVTHGTSRLQPEAEAGQSREEVIVRGLLQAWKSQADRGTTIIAIRDNPIARADTPGCVARYGLRANEFCALDRAVATGTFDGGVRAASLLPGAHIVDLTDYYCTNEVCLTVIGHVPVYRDADHITATFAHTLAPFIRDRIKAILAD